MACALLFYSLKMYLFSNFKHAAISVLTVYSVLGALIYATPSTSNESKTQSVQAFAKYLESSSSLFLMRQGQIPGDGFSEQLRARVDEIARKEKVTPSADPVLVEAMQTAMLFHEYFRAEQLLNQYESSLTL